MEGDLEVSDSPPEPRLDLLVGLAMLQADWDRRQQTYLDNFRRFVIEVLRARGTLSTAEVSQRVAERFGVNMPVGVLNTLLKRMRRQELVTGDPAKGWSPTAQLEASPLLAPEPNRTARGISALISRLVEWVREVHDLDWSEAKAESALQAFAGNWSWSLSIMRSELDGSRRDSPLPVVEDYIVASYALELQDRDPDTFDWLMSVVKGSMVSAGLYLDEGMLSSKLTKLTVYLDTPLLIDLLAGFSAQQRAIESLVALARELGAVTACFEHTLDELHSVLEGQAASLRNLRQGSVKRRGGTSTINPALTSSEIERISQEAQQRLARAQVVVKADSLSAGRPMCDEDELDSRLQADINYVSSTTRDKDLRSLIAVHRIRRASTSDPLHLTKAVFVTNNTGLVRSAAGFFGTDKTPHGVPFAFSDDEFSTLLWLKSPTPPPDLPWVRLIADCHAAMSPPDNLWIHYLDTVDELRESGDIDDETYFMARYANEARAELVRSTRGHRSKLNSKTVAEVLEGTKETLTAPAREALEAERLRRLEAERAVAVAKQETDGLAKAVVVGEQRGRLEGFTSGHSGAVQTLAHRVSRSVGSVAAILLVALGVAGFVWGPVANGIVSVVLILVAALFFLASAFGWALHEKAADAVEPHLVGLFSRLAASPPDKAEADHHE